MSQLNQQLNHTLDTALSSIAKRRRSRTWLLALSLLLMMSFGAPAVALAEWGDEITPIGTLSDFTRSTAWGDMDADGDLDIAVGNAGSPNRIFENQGGTFSLAWESDDSANTTSVAWGDMDGDGDLDLAVGNNKGENQVFRNDNGQFTLAWHSAGDTKRTTTIAWVDWDQDGLLDLAVANGTDFLDKESNQIFENSGDSFTLAWETPEDEVAITYSMAWGDWDGDGDLDPIFGNRTSNQVYENTGGNLQLYQTLDGTYGQSTAVAWGDWDGDGDLDLVLGNQANYIDSTLTGAPNQIYRNDPGGFVEAWHSSEESITRSVAWGDWDGDGDLDLAVGNTLFSDTDGDQGIQIYENNEGDLILAWSTTDPEAKIWNVAWGDMDNDGDLDLLTGESSHPNQVYVNNAGAPWSAQTISALPDGRRGSHISLGDWDGDSDLDLAVSESGNVYVYSNQGGQFVKKWTLPDGGASSYWGPNANWGDWNGDGQLDLVVSLGNEVAVYENIGNDFLQIWQSEPGQSLITSIDWGDWDQDGDLDLAIGRLSSANQVYENAANRFNLVWESSDNKRTLSVAWGDMDNDGDLDLAVGNGKELDQNGTTLGEVNQIFENTGNALTLFWESTDLGETNSVAWGDVDGDGDLDLAAGSDIALASEGAPATNYLYYYTENGFTAMPIPGPIRRTDSMAWGDVDGDGDLDLAVGNLGIVDDGFNQLFRNDAGVLNFAWEWSGDVYRTRSVVWGDVDGDGDLDLVVGNDLAPSQLYMNYRIGADRLSNNPLMGQIQWPGQIDSVRIDVFAAQLQGPIIPISYTLRGPELHALASVQGYYSLNGGGQWIPAVATTDTMTTGLSTGKRPELSEGLPDGDFHIFLPVVRDGSRRGFAIVPQEHIFKWDASQNGLGGEYNNVVFRLDIFSGYGPFQRSKSTIYSPPFRIRIPGNLVGRNLESRQDD